MTSDHVCVCTSAYVSVHACVFVYVNTCARSLLFVKMKHSGTKNT